MPICRNCKQEWSWKQTVKKMLTLHPDLTCPYCGEKQYQTQKSKHKASLFTGIVIFTMIMIPNIFDISFIGIIAILPVLIVLILCIYPFFVGLSSTEEHSDFFKAK